MRVIEKALSLWGFEKAQVKLIAARENSVYRIDFKTQTYALRIHRKGYRTNTQLSSELDWMAWIKASGLSVPMPLASKNGLFLHVIDGFQVDILSWMLGDTMDNTLSEISTDRQSQLFYILGCEMAKLHNVSDKWPEAKNCDRPDWNVEGLLGETPLWGRFWENPRLTPKEQDVFLRFRRKAKQKLDAKSQDLDYALIHADLVPANVMTHVGAVHFIDFDDGGFGFRIFELATTLLKHSSLPNYENLKVSLVIKPS